MREEIRDRRVYLGTLVGISRVTLKGVVFDDSVGL